MKLSCVAPLLLVVGCLDEDLGVISVSHKFPRPVLNEYLIGITRLVEGGLRPG